MKKFISKGLLVIMLLGCTMNVSADEGEQDTATVPTTKETRIMERKIKLEDIAAEKEISVEELVECLEKTRLEAEAMGMTTEEYRAYKKAEKDAERQARLGEAAEKRGITVEELLILMEDNKVTAEELGMSIEEYKDYLKEQRQAERQAKLEERAANRDITVEELIALIEAQKLAIEESGMTREEYQEYLQEERAAQKESKLEDLGHITLMKEEAEALGMTLREYKEYIKGLEEDGSEL